MAKVRYEIRQQLVTEKSLKLPWKFTVDSLHQIRSLNSIDTLFGWAYEREGKAVFR